MLNYWFLYRADGTIYGAPYLGNADEWTNIPPECSGVLGPFDVASASEAVQDAYAHPERYLVQNGQLVEQPYFTLTSSTANSQYTVTATLNNPPTTPPTSVTFTVAGQTFTETLTNGQATLTLAVHPSVATEQINVSVSASGCVGASINIGGSGTDVALQVVTPCGGTPTVGPAGANAVQFLQTYYAVNSTTVEALLTNIATGMSLLNDAVFNVILPALQATTYTPVTLSADQSNTFSDMKTNLLPNLFTTLANGYPIGGTEQMQFAAFVKNFQNAAANVTNFMQALQTFNL